MWGASKAMSCNQPKPVSINVTQVVSLSASTFPFINATRSLIHKTNYFQINPRKHNLSDLYPTNLNRMGKSLWAVTINFNVNCKSDTDTKIVSTALDLAEKHGKDLLLLQTTQKLLWSWFFIWKSQMVTSCSISKTSTTRHGI